MKIGVWAPSAAFSNQPAGLKLDVDIIRMACEHYGYDFGICDKQNVDFDLVFMMEVVAPKAILNAGKQNGTKFAWCINTELLSLHTGSVDKKDMVDFYIGKTNGQKEYIDSLNWPKQTMLLNFATPDNTNERKLSNDRNAVVHFAGTSWFKNSTNQLKAGIRLVSEGHFDKMYLKLSGQRGQVQDMIRRLKKIVGDNKKIEVIDEYISEEKKQEIYLNSRLALCASSREGFGHSILEAAGYGCQVVTTDGNPMRELLSKQVYLAKATRRLPEDDSSIWGYRYSVEEDDIYNAGVRAANDIYSADDCADNLKARWSLFLDDFKRVAEEVGEREEKESAWELF